MNAMGFTNPVMAMRELQRQVPRGFGPPLQRVPPAPVPSESRSALAADAAANARTGTSKLRLLDAAERGEFVPVAALLRNIVPDTVHHQVDRYKSRVYGGCFVGPEGERFVTSCQDKRIRVYDTGKSECRRAWKLTHCISAKGVRWTITDFDVSPDGRWLAYSTISTYVCVVDLADPKSEQMVLDFAEGTLRSFGIWSIKWGHDGREIIAGTSGGERLGRGCIIAYDVQSKCVVDVVPAHEQDVNSVCFMRTGERNILLSGADDALVKMWDRREIRTKRPGEVVDACGVFVGHSEGLTFVSTRDDGRFVLSNGKDQYIKLWDARRTTSSAEQSRMRLPHRNENWDYRFQPYHGGGSVQDHRCNAVMTYAGSHETLQTLIRARFSPVFTTAQKYIYCGSSDGACVIYDVLTGACVRRLRGHSAPVRDVSWHPSGTFLTTSSWDCHVMLWSTYADAEYEAELERTRVRGSGTASRAQPLVSDNCPDWWD